MIEHQDYQTDMALWGFHRALKKNDQWSRPELRERSVCDNCDGAPDGGHADDALCIRSLEEIE